jgi:4'-phosphopantetheinyl transferase
MPEVWRKTDPLFRIIIWQSTESTDELLAAARLSDSDLTAFHSFKSDKRKREWVSVRTALRMLDPAVQGSITYNADGRPNLIGDRSISISHSGNYIAIMLSDAGKTGIDIEEIHPRIELLAKKFVNENEKSFIMHANQMRIYHVIWGAKEVLFKIYSRGGIDFRKDLHVNPFEYQVDGSCYASIKKNEYERSFHVYYHEMSGYMLAYTVGEE